MTALKLTFTATLLLVATVVWTIPAARADVIADADAAMQAHDVATAARLYTKAIESGTASGDQLYQVLYRRGLAYIGLNRPKDAIADLDIVLDNDWCWAAALGMRAYATLLVGHLDLALAYANAAVRADPDLPASYKLRSLMLAKAGDRTGATEDNRMAVALAPDPRFAQRETAYCYLSVGMIDRTIETLRGFKAQGIETPATTALLAWLEAAHGGDANVARKRLTQVSGTAPPAGPLARAWLASLSAGPDRIRLIRDASEADPQNLLLGLIYVDSLQAGGTPHPFAPWRRMMADQPHDTVTAELLALDKRRPFDKATADGLAQDALEKLKQPFGSLRAFGISLLLAADGFDAQAGQLRDALRTGSYPYGTGLLEVYLGLAS